MNGFKINTKYPSEIDGIVKYHKEGEDIVDSSLATPSYLLAQTIVALETKLGIDGGLISKVGGIEFIGSDHSLVNISVWVNNSGTGGYNLFYTDNLGIDYLIGGPDFIGGGGSGLSLGETSITAYRGDRGKIAYDHSQTTGNPHNVTKSDISLGNVSNIDCSTTSSISDSTDKRFVTDAQLTVLGNTSGTNTGDSAGHSSLVPTSRTVNGHVLSSDVTVTKSDISLSNVPNLDCSTTTNISDSTNKRFVTDSYLTVLGNTSGTNTGDSSGHENLVPNIRTVNGYALNSNISISKNDIGLSNAANLDCSTTANRWRVYIPKTGTIKAVYIYSYAGTAGSAENWSMNVRKNNITDTLIQTLAASTNDRIWSNTSLNISVVAGDYVEIKEVQPAWVTNPATVTRSGVIYIE